MALLAAFAVLLHRLSGQHDFAIGTPMVNRQHTELEPLIGLFLSTLVLRMDLEGDPTFRELLGRVKGRVVEAFANSDVPFERVVEELQPERNLEQNPLFQVFFNLLNTGRSEPAAGWRAGENGASGEATSPFDLTLYALEEDGYLLLSLLYKRELFDTTMARAMIEQLAVLLQSIVCHPDRRISAHDLGRALPPPSTGCPRRQDGFPAPPQSTAQSRIGSSSRRAYTWNGPRSWSGTERGVTASSLMPWRALAAPFANAWATSRNEWASCPARAAKTWRPSSARSSRGIRTYRWIRPTPTHVCALFSVTLQPRPCCSTISTADKQSGCAVADEGIALSSLLVTEARGLPHVPPDRVAYLLYTSGTTGQPKGISQSQRNLACPRALLRAKCRNRARGSPQPAALMQLRRFGHGHLRRASLRSRAGAA